MLQSYTNSIFVTGKSPQPDLATKVKNFFSGIRKTSTKSKFRIAFEYFSQLNEST